MPNKAKIYLDTSAISHLEQPEKPSEQTYTLEMFKRIQLGAFSVYLSSVVIEEIMASPQAKKDALMEHIANVNFIDIPLTDEVQELGKKIIIQNVLPPKSVNDSLHIAAAIIAGCDYAVSWNMKHMANVRTNKGIRHITLDEGHKEIMLVPPSMLLLEGSSFDEA